MKTKILLAVVLLLLLISNGFSQDGELAATLEVLAGTIEVKRVNTENWIVVNIEAIVGVGDTIRTGESGQARITFFSDGVETDILPNSEFAIDTFTGGTAVEDSFNLEVSVLIGQTVQRLGRVLDASSSYDVNTPGMTLAARGTEFAIRVEDDGRAGMLVKEGLVDAAANDSNVDVPAEFGIRSGVEENLSDVVRASTFSELDSGLDGCIVTVTTLDDVRLNVRIAPDVEAFRIGTIDASDIDIFYGVNTSGNWYRIMFNGGFGWTLSTSSKVRSGCAGLRVFSDDHSEDVDSYDSFGEVIDPSGFSSSSSSSSESSGDAEATQEPTE
jgi:hypothetical protein